MAVFEDGINVILGEGVAIATQRGGEYADSWHLDNLVTTFTANTLSSFGVSLSPRQLRLVLLAALIDVKDSRMVGPYKEDTVIDGINYRAVFAYLRRQLDRSMEPAPTSTKKPCAFPGCVDERSSVVHKHGYNAGVTTGCPADDDFTGGKPCDYNSLGCHPFKPNI
jgi:hypothetical protein